jgi:branched-chain amino acid transport system substrate-binding protein
MGRKGTASSGWSDTSSRRRFLRDAGATAIGTTLLSGCVQQQGEDGDTTTQNTDGDTTTEQSLSGTVTFGVLNPMSGPFSSLGPAQRKGAELAVEFVNNSDEFDFEVDPVYEDTATDPATARQKASRLVDQDGAQFLAGAINSSVALALADFAAQNEVVYSSGGAALELTGENCNQYTFRSETNTAQQVAGMVGYTLDNLGSKIWIHTADYAYGNSAIGEIRKAIEGTDAEILGTTTPQQGTSDFGPHISQIQNSDAEVLAIPLTGGDLINFMKQAESRGLNEEIDIIGTALFAQALRAPLGSAAAGTYSSTLYNHKLETGDNQQFVQAFQDAHDAPPGHFSRVGYESVRMTARGVQAAGSKDPSTVKDSLAGTPMTSILGEREFRECDHQAVNPVWTSKINAADNDLGTSVEIVNEVSGEEATPPCSESNCSL